MKYLLMDPLNIKEWNDINATEKLPGMDVYFAYQTFAGAILHLVVLGAIMVLLLGIIGSFSGLLQKRKGSFIPQIAILVKTYNSNFCGIQDDNEIWGVLGKEAAPFESNFHMKKFYYKRRRFLPL